MESLSDLPPCDFISSLLESESSSFCISFSSSTFIWLNISLKVLFFMVNWLIKLSNLSWAYDPSLMISSCWGFSYCSSSGMFGFAFGFLGASGGTSSLNFFALLNFCFLKSVVGGFEFPYAFDYCCNFLLIFVILLFFWKSGCWSSMQASDDADGLNTAFPALEPLLFLALSFGFSSEFLRTLDYYIYFFYFCFYNRLAFKTLCSSSFIMMYSKIVLPKVLPIS